jgi:DNA primase
MRSDTEEIKKRINIVDLVGEYVPLKKSGTNFRGLCPFHDEKTPSFMVSPSKQIWHCFGCGMGGDHFEFIEQMEGSDFREALELLAKRAGIQLVAPSPVHRQQQDKKKVLFEINEWAAKYYAKVLSDSPQAQSARDYLAKRGFKPETVKAWQLGFAPDDFHNFENFIIQKGYQRSEVAQAGLLVEKDGGFYDRFRGRIMFPLFDIHGRVVGFTARILQGDEKTAKYINSPETLIYNKSELLYGLNFAKIDIRKQEKAIVVEGNADVITAHEAGYQNVIGSSGTALTESHLQALERFTEQLVFAFDVDEAGLAAARRAVEMALSKGFEVSIVAIPFDQAKDPDELIRKDPQLWEERVRAAKPFMDFYFEQTFAKITPDTSQRKKLAVKELLPLVALMPNPIDRAHYTKKLADRIQVEERLIMEILNKHLSRESSSVPVSQETKTAVAKKSKLEVLERRALGLLLKFTKQLRGEWQDLDEAEFSVPVLKEIFIKGKKQAESAPEEANFETIFSDFPEQLGQVKLLVFGTENELERMGDWDLNKIKKEFFDSLRQETIKTRMKDLGSLIRTAEASGEISRVKELSFRFNNLSKELTRFYGD